MKKKELKTIEKIAKEHLFIETLERRGLDDFDFHECGVASIKDALLAAYEAGKQAVTGEAK